MFATRNASRPSPRAIVLLAGAVGSIALFASAASAYGTSTAKHRDAARPTVVLVHGAFADATGWSGVIKRLQADGYPVIAPANPLRSLGDDAAYIASVLEQTPGPL